MPRLSVLMPAYDAAGTVGQAVRSTLRDLPRDAEIVVLDDGSSDSTVEVLQRIEDPRLRVRSHTNVGVARTLDELLETTDSEFVARMDADDLVLPGRFRRELRALGEGDDAVFTTVVSWGSGRVPDLPRPSGIAPEEFGLHLLLTNPVAHSTLMARRSAVMRVDGYRAIPTEDYDLWLRMAADGSRLRRLAVPGLAYRVHPEQVTASREWRRSSWQNPEIGAAFSSLAERLIGAPATRITSLTIDDSLTDDEKRARFEAFAVRFTAAVERQDRAARRALERKLVERSAWFEGRLGEDAGSRGRAATGFVAEQPGTSERGRQPAQHPAAGRSGRSDRPGQLDRRERRRRYREVRAADRAANRAYPKSRFVLGWFRLAQHLRGGGGPLARAAFIAVGGSYKIVTEGFMGIELPVSTEVGPGLRLRHGFGVVVNPASRIGANVMLRHGVTLGNRATRDDCPVIEDDVELGVGAVIVGAVTVGRGARIGPNAVVIRDVPAGAVVYSPVAPSRGSDREADQGSEAAQEREKSHTNGDL